MCACVHVCVCVLRKWDVWRAGPSYLLYFVLCIYDNKRTVDFKEQQLKWTQSGSYKLQGMQSGNSS